LIPVILPTPGIIGSGSQDGPAESLVTPRANGLREIDSLSRGGLLHCVSPDDRARPQARVAAETESGGPTDGNPVPAEASVVPRSTMLPCSSSGAGAVCRVHESSRLAVVVSESVWSVAEPYDALLIVGFGGP